MSSSLTQVPLFERLAGAERILVAGCGGGFDIYCGVPLALALWKQNKTVILSNLTFATPRAATGIEPIGDVVTRIDAGTTSPIPYFPELYLSFWLRREGHADSIYCFERTGVVPLREAFLALIKRERIDAIVVVDGGTDSLMRGDEVGLGTPHEDAATLCALDEVDVPRTLVCAGFGVDTFHGVCHAHFLENTAALSQKGAFLGTFSLLPGQPETDGYLSAVRFATEHEPNHPSIVNTSVVAAVAGHFGDYHSTRRTEGSTLFINPLMSMYWCYELQAVVDRLLYSDILRETKAWSEVTVAVEGARKIFQGKRSWIPIPC